MEFTKEELVKLRWIIVRYLVSAHTGTYLMADVRDALLLHDKIENELLYEDTVK